ncbi:hypothetical protein GPECTOR_29g89 [Gonium pectorale]|uniref:phytol kinase n=1 Tax=Gonium pectorale TaxID=33097 RepID=A0A150GER2_GONPE|nr:hypothetical protein GPECTOR_29g89 [Gonium pectorale]|eukprot:KXZ48314.1 hypothetical protein GPECTOR_29g89 [Gonium pectorale]
MVFATSAYVNLCWMVDRWSGPRGGPDGTRLAARLRAVSSGRCVQHAARCIGLAALCDANGGSAYGLPPELLASLASGQGAGGSGPVGREMRDDTVTQLRAMVCMMQLGDPAPPGRRGTLALAMRVGRLAVASIQEPAAAAPVAGPSGTAAVAAAAAPPLPWPAGLLREAAAGLRSCGDQDMAAHAEGLAAYLELGGDGACGALRQASLPPAPLASALSPPTEARRLLPGRCANPRCANLEGDSEAVLTLKPCAGCGAVGYCCRPCQTAHWREGHKGECAGMRRNGAR